MKFPIHALKYKNICINKEPIFSFPSIDDIMSTPNNQVTTPHTTQTQLIHHGERISTALKCAYQTFRWTPTNQNITIDDFIDDIWEGIKQCLRENTGTNKIMVTLECRILLDAGKEQEAIRSIQGDAGEGAE